MIASLRDKVAGLEQEIAGKFLFPPSYNIVFEIDLTQEKSEHKREQNSEHF